MKIAPMLSTQTIMGNSTSMPIKSRPWMMNLLSFVASDRGTNSGSLEDRVMLLWAQLFQLMGTPIRKMQNPMTLILVSVSPVLSLSKNTTRFQDSPIAFSIGSILRL